MLQTENNQNQFFSQPPILASIIAGIIAVTNTPGKFDFFDTIIGGMLLLIIMSSEIKPNTIIQKIALACIYGFIFLLIFGFLTSFVEFKGSVQGSSELIIWLAFSILSLFVIKKEKILS